MNLGVIMAKWQNVSEKTYGGTEDNEAMERMYNQPIPSKKEGRDLMLQFCRYCSGFGVILIFIAVIMAGFSFLTLSSIIGIVGCCMALFGMFVLWIYILIVFPRKKDLNG